MTPTRSNNAAALAPRMTTVARLALVVFNASSWYGIGAVIARGCLARRSALLAAGPLLVAGELGGVAPFVERSRRNEQADHELAMMIHLGKHPNPLEAAGMSQLFDLMHESPDHEVHTEHMNSPPPGVKTRQQGAARWWRKAPELSPSTPVLHASRATLIRPRTAFVVEMLKS